MFRRRQRADEPDEPDDYDDEAASVDEASEEVTGGAADPEPTRAGPFDDADVSDDDGMPRVDLGGLRVPISPELELRLEVSEEQQVVAATLIHGASAMQVSAFAAPKSTGIWADVRTEIIDTLRQSGGSGEPADGPLGPEIRARIPAEVPGQGVVLQPARFIGADGPRWFLRGLLTGPAATDPAQAHHLEDAFRSVVVVRGGEAMAPRDPLPLHLPREAMESGALPDGDEEPPGGIDPFERGPEITEVR